MARNTNRQGAGFELEIMHYLAGTLPETWGPGFGYDCLRSSGSKGKIDVVAVGEAYRIRMIERPSLIFIQAKIKAPVHSTPLSPAERTALMNLAMRAGALPLTASKAKDAVTGRVRPHFRLLTGSGPRDWMAWEPGEDN